MAEEDADRADCELLRRFASGRDEAAFQDIIHRHGAMVLAVCRRIVANPHDAEDAFQAVFMVLVRKGLSLRDPGSLGGWLHGVAVNVALRAREGARTRKDREAEGSRMHRGEAPAEEAWGNIRPLLDEELVALPEKYRSALVLCYLEGKSAGDAARVLECPKSTVTTRLSKALDLLRSRLVGRGVAITGTLLVALMVKHGSAAVAPALVSTTTQLAGLALAGSGAAAGGISPVISALVKGTSKAMLVSKLKVGVAVVLAIAGMAGAATVFVAQQAGTKEPELVPPALVGAEREWQGRFLDMHALIRPQPGESRWRELPWMLDLWEARKKAASEGKPILVWWGGGAPPGGPC